MATTDTPEKKSMEIKGKREASFVKKYRTMLQKTCPYCGLGYETHEKRCRSAIVERGEIRRCMFIGDEPHDHVYRQKRAVTLTTRERELMQ